MFTKGQLNRVLKWEKNMANLSACADGTYTAPGEEKSSEKRQQASLEKWSYRPLCFLQTFITTMIHKQKSYIHL